ncbi:hypothetical protein BDR26DRAFT_861896 [Obelidium mucronatum]|nr:hypothetical protein BDR26DRAFT_861896 [Obelidium mucronatum]
MSAEVKEVKFSQSAAVTRCRNIKESKLKAQEAIAKLADEEATIYSATLEQTRHQVGTQMREQALIELRQLEESKDSRVSWERKDQLTKLIDKLGACKATIRFQQEARERDAVFKASIRQKRAAFQVRLARLEQRQAVERNELANSQKRLADTVGQIRAIELKSIRDSAKLNKVRKENELMARQSAVRQQRETDHLRDIQLVKARQLGEINDLEIQNLEEIEDIVSSQRAEEFDILARHQVIESEILATFERQKGVLEAGQLLEKQKALRTAMQRAQKKQLASLAKAQRLASRTREKMLLADNPMITGSGTTNEIEVEDSESEGTTDTRSEGTARSGASQDDISRELAAADEEDGGNREKAELEKNMAINKNGSKVLSESEKEVLALEQTAQERLRSTINHHKKLVSEMKQVHRNLLHQKTKEHRRKLADLLKDHEEEIEQVKVDQTSSMNELMNIQNQEDGASENQAESISSTLPQHVMEQIQRGIPHEPEQFSTLTVAFADIYDFRKLTATIGVPKTLNLINALFEKFDAIAFKYSLLYKVESVSEVFMIAGGISSTYNKTEQEITEFTRQILACVRELHQFAEKFDFNPFAGDFPVQLRFGVHSGPTSGGLVGTRVGRYGIFGDGVITATRVCGKGEPGKIQVTAEVISALGEDEHFEFEERGKIEIKGRGSMQTFWLLE